MMHRREATSRRVWRYRLSGDVPVEKWGELCRRVVMPAKEMDLTTLGEVQFLIVVPEDVIRGGVPVMWFEMVLPERKALCEDARELTMGLEPGLKMILDAARQLGLTYEVLDGSEV